MALLTFGDFVLDTADKRVLRHNRRVGLAGMPLEVLCYFVEHAADGRIVTRDELRKQIWRCKVEDGTIRSCISNLREALGDPVARPRYLETQGRAGWRLLRPVSRLPRHSRSVLPPAPGGAYDAAYYVSRPAEEKMLSSCLQAPGRAAVIFGPPGSGKRLLIEHTIAKALQDEIRPLGRALRVSVRSAAVSPAASLDELLKEVGRLLLQASGQPDEGSRRTLEALWSSPIPAKEKLRELLLHILAPGAPSAKVQPIALVLYEADCLASCGFQEDVFNMLRAWQDDPFLGSMRLLIETSLPSRLFPMGGQSSLWTKVHRVDVSRINWEQLLRLAELHHVPSSKLECDRLGELVGWNVYLCRVALFHAAVRGLSLGAVLDAYQPEQRAFGAFADHLEDLSHDLEHLDATGAFSKPIGLLLKEAADGVSLPLETAWRLLRKGVVAATETRGCFRSRCPLYTDFFRVAQS
ncbi:MAG TPA: AAA-like domain-containing protein [Pseudomonadota bacterium]|nr:AAA-like domain-containing protein [Pseudomonadota bacterium]